MPLSQAHDPLLQHIVVALVNVPVLACVTGFLAKINYLSQTASCVAILSVMHSASDVDKVTVDCFLLSEPMTLLP